MRMLPVVGLALSVVFLLSGCLPPQHSATPTPLPTSTPGFASDEEALAAAKVAYGEYQAAVDRALSDYDTSGLEKVATGDALALARKSVADFQKKSLRQVGKTSVDTVSLARVGQDQGGGTSSDNTQIYACLDTAAVKVIDSSGLETGTVGRQTRFPVLVDLEFIPVSRELVVANEAVWDADDFCN